MRFNAIPKQGTKDKFQVVKEPNTVIGHIDYNMPSGEYIFTPLHGSRYNTIDMCSVCDKMNQLNSELKK